VEGGGSKSFSAIKTLLFRDPAIGHELLRVCAETAGAYLAAQVDAGADAAMLFDTWAGLLSPSDIETFVTPYVRRVFEQVQAAARAAGRFVPRIYYAGNAGGWIGQCRSVGADVIGLDWRMDLDLARGSASALTLQGNLDPAVLLGTRDLIEARAAAVLKAGGGRRHIFNLGHGILPETPPDHARFLVDVVRELSSRRPE
jgi:uroporphyrinogen decarboxylase